MQNLFTFYLVLHCQNKRLLVVMDVQTIFFFQPVKLNHCRKVCVFNEERAEYQIHYAWIHPWMNPGHQWYDELLYTRLS